MITKVAIPKFDANIEEGTIGQWLKAERSEVKKGEPLVEVITDKAVFELESPGSGVLRKIIAAEKSVLPVGYIIALIGGAGDPLPDVDGTNRKLLDARRRALQGKEDGTKAHVRKPGAGDDSGPLRATPAARRVARERSIDLVGVKKATGAEVITEQVLLDFIAGKG